MMPTRLSYLLIVNTPRQEVGWFTIERSTISFVKPNGGYQRQHRTERRGRSWWAPDHSWRRRPKELEWHSLQTRHVRKECRHKKSIREHRHDPSKWRCVRPYSCRFRSDPLHHRRKSAPRIRRGSQAVDRKRSRRFHLHQTRRASRSL